MPEGKGKGVNPNRGKGRANDRAAAQAAVAQGTSPIIPQLRPPGGNIAVPQPVEHTPRPSRR